MKYFILILLCFPQIIFAQTVVALSPGVKLGYSFGEDGGFTMGIETSIMIGVGSYKPNNFRYGLVISIEKLNKKSILHIGGQINLPGPASLAGIEIGPTIFFNEPKKNVGYSYTFYFGGFIIPYIRLHKFPEQKTKSEVGTFIKYHHIISGRYIFS